jgi:hypothetical protein
MNIYKPFIVEAHGTQTNEYIPYNVFSTYKVWNSNTNQAEARGSLLYTGKTWMDENGNSDVNITDVLKDFVYFPSVGYNKYVQRYTLSEAGAHTLTDLHPIEENGQIYNNAVWLRWNNTGAPYVYDTETTKTNVYAPFYNVPLNPYDNNTGVIFYNSIGTSITPEIPYISTDNFYFGWCFGFDERFKNDTIRLGNMAGTGTTITKNLNNQWGNFFPLYTLSELYGVFTSPVNNLYVTFIAADASHVVPVPTKIVNVNKNCPYDFYIGWFTPWGAWQSQGFNEKHTTAEETIKRETLTTMQNQKKEYQTDLDFKRTLTKTCNKETAQLLNSITLSPCIWLYDVKNDYGTPVICTNTGVRTEAATRLNVVDLTFETIQHYTY